MAKNGKNFFDVNFDKNIIKDYIKTNLQQDEITDENIDIFFKMVITGIVDEALPNLKDLYLSKNYKFIQIKIVGHKEEPTENNITISIDPDCAENFTVTSKR